MRKTNRNLLVDFLTQVWTSLLSTSVRGSTPKPSTVGPVIIRAVPKNLAFETRFQIDCCVCECLAMVSAACVNTPTLS
jgi:hypothetical protein